ncbi:sarcosine oxidase subunit gamma [Novosphingobium beihaiensis]|uniref:Sarcosine oxidase gamma subunit n=1 Tax=Novosphingobium beihaiensis TaxID=2930389 RepID=A0ABT0BVY1_9SPHN|nr:sarcosine oxidase gamma subunit [Novosphingobium beihaiensis]MCJ2189212.1 sarcosine oxidase gamma subunit [Novosphingobium beihaiensis]
MSSLSVSTSPLPDEPFAADGVRVSRSAALQRYSLRARDPAKLAAVVGRELPGRIGGVTDGIAQLGPDEFLALLPVGTQLPSGEEEPVSVVDISSRAVGITVEGEGAAALIMSGCPLDLDRMAPGQATRTIYETVEMVLVRESETRFHIEVWRSFAPWLWQSLRLSAE